MIFPRFLTRSLLAACALVLAACGGAQSDTAAAAAVQTREQVIVAAWNIEWLGAPDRRWEDNAGIAREAEDLAEVIDDAAPDVLALMEIIDTDLADNRRRNAILDETFTLLNAKGASDWRYEILPLRHADGQHMAIAWNNAAVSPAGELTRVPVPVSARFRGRSLLYRTPYGMKFSAGEGMTDFVVIPIHLKADWQGDFGEQRALEAELLTHAIPEAGFDDADIVIIDNTNCAGHEDAAIQVFQAVGWIDLNRDDTSTHITGKALDRVFVPLGQPEFTDSGQVTLGDSYFAEEGMTAQEFVEEHSDHYLIMAPIAVMPDDD